MPKIHCENHQRVKVGHTIVEFFDGVAEVSQEVADVLLLLSGGDGKPEYFLIEEEMLEVVEEQQVETPKKVEEKKSTNQPKQFDKGKGFQRGR